MAFLCACSSLVSITGLVYLAGPSRVVPFVVAIDSLGRSIASGPAEQATAADDRLRRATILSWLEDLRTVSTDPHAQRKAIDRVYAHIASGTQPSNRAGEWLQTLMRYICKNGFEHHAAMNTSSCGPVLAAAMQDYLGWDVYGHEI